MLFTPFFGIFGTGLRAMMPRSWESRKVTLGLAESNGSYVA